MDDRRKKALEAGTILNSSVFTDALDSIRERAIETWEGAKTPQEREEAWFLQRACGLLHRELFNILQCAAVVAGGKDKILNNEVENAKEKLTNGRTRKRSK